VFNTAILEILGQLWEDIMVENNGLGKTTSYRTTLWSGQHTNEHTLLLGVYGCQQPAHNGSLSQTVTVHMLSLRAGEIFYSMPPEYG